MEHPVIMEPSLILFGAGLVLGIIPCLIWGTLGGDEGFTNNRIRPLLKLIHHWHVGVILMVIGYYTSPLVYGWGVGTAMDDLLFHSFEKYFKRD